MPLDLPLEISCEPAPELLTAFGGLPLVSRTFRALKLPESIGRNLAIKKRDRGLREAQMIESFVLLNAAGGDCVDDFQRLPHDEGGRGYQPAVAVWAEMNLVAADEFRDGNVPAMMEPLTVAKRAFAALPKTVEQFYYRADSASHEAKLLSWLRDENREDGPKGKIGFGISARMSPPLAKAIAALPEEGWKPTHAPGEDVDELRDVAEVPFVPSEKSERKDAQPLRYVAIRVRPRQRELFADGSAVKHFAVLSNRWDIEAGRLLQWHREKAGTVEQVHDIVKNELAGGVLPCGRFGANAAWLRLAYLSHNVLVALKRIALPPELLAARPKKLRFEIFVQAGRLVHHARQLLLRLAATVGRITIYRDAWRLILSTA